MNLDKKQNSPFLYTILQFLQGNYIFELAKSIHMGIFEK